MGAVVFGLLSVLIVWVIAGVIGGDMRAIGAAKSLASPSRNITQNQVLRPHQPDTPIPATLFGMHTMGVVRSLPIPYGAQAKSTGTAWPYLEPKRGVFDWDPEDTAVDVAEDNHVAPPFYSTDGIPPWATTDKKTCEPHLPGGPLLCSAMMKRIKDWNTFIAALVRRYKSRIMYEMWDEPNTRDFSGTVSDMVKIINHEHNIIRRIDPRAVIISPSGDAEYMDRFFADGGTRDVDIVSYHEYDSMPEDAIATIHAVRAVMAKYKIFDKPLWDTEGGWGPIPYVKGKIDDYPGYVARRYLIEWSAGADRLYWYAWDNQKFGTLSNDGKVANAAGIAYRETFKWMVGAVMDHPCMKSGAIWTCPLVRPGGYKALAVWTAKGNLSYAPPIIYRQYRELSGNRIVFKPGSVITVGVRPILLENKTTSRSALSG
jgi:hypothetical protein